MFKVGTKLARGVKKVLGSIGFQNTIQQLLFWYGNQVVTSNQMNTFSQDLYDKIAALTDTVAPCVVTLKGTISLNNSTLTLPIGFFRFVDTTYSFMTYSSCICGIAPATQLTITGNGFVVARYTVSPTTTNQTNYTFPTQYLFVQSVNPITDCIVCVITDKQISGYGQFLNTPSINDNGQIVNIKNTLNALGGLAITGSGTLNNKNIATTDMITTYRDITDSGELVSITGTGGLSVPKGAFTSKSIIDNGTQVATSKPLIVNGINTQGNGLIAYYSNSNIYYNKFATGWISQGGLAYLTNNVATITFPLAFTNKVFSINVITCGETRTSTGWVAVGDATTLTSFLVRSSSAVNPSQQFYWQAEGY
jgi:hypothetical protein